MDGFVEYITQDVLSSFDGITVKKLFSGYGVYSHGVIFAIIIDDVFYFKVDKSNINEFKNMDESKPFTYERENKIITLPYWSVPEDKLEDREEMERLARLSFQVGHN